MGKSLLDYLKEVPDHRGRQGKRYRLYTLLALVVLAAINGKSSLRSMVKWVQAHQEQLIAEGRLDLWHIGCVPQYSTFWEALNKIKMEELEAKIACWAAEQEGGKRVSVDGKHLRGSKRSDGTPALQVVAMVVEGTEIVRRQSAVDGGDEVAAAIEILKKEPLEGKVVTLDAGLLVRPVIETVLKQGGGYLGVVKKNQAEVREAINIWLPTRGLREEGERRAADAVQIDKAHGRLERRELWLEPAGELSAYLERELGWPGVQWCGRIRRTRQMLRSGKTTESEEIWVAGGAFELPGDAHQISAWLRGHWAIENKVFYVRDVTYREDSLHARSVGWVLSSVRDIAINLLRRAGFRYIPDGHSAAAARSDRALCLLLHPV
jgi:hypothetical protein